MDKKRTVKKEKSNDITPRQIVGDNIRRERKKRNFTIEELAELAGMSASHLGLVERGERGLSIDKQFSVAAVFNMDLSDLLKHSASYNMAGQEQGIAHLTLNEDAEPYVVNRRNYDAVLSLISKMNEDELGFLIGVIKSLKHLLKSIT